jgi:hypothetical protein
MFYVLVLVVLGSNVGSTQPLPIGHYRSLETCQAAANEAKGIGLDKGSFGFVCARSLGPLNVAIER